MQPKMGTPAVSLGVNNGRVWAMVSKLPDTLVRVPQEVGNGGPWDSNGRRRGRIKKEPSTDNLGSVAQQ